MAKQALPKPTQTEVTILGILWSRGPSTVKQVHEIMSQEKDTGYTTTLKLMQIMFEKKLLVRQENTWPHIYEPGISEESTQLQLVRDLIDRAFSGSAEKLVMRALSTKKLSKQQMTKLRKLLNEMRGA